MLEPSGPKLKPYTATTNAAVAGNTDLLDIALTIEKVNKFVANPRLSIMDDVIEECLVPLEIRHATDESLAHEFDVHALLPTRTEPLH